MRAPLAMHIIDVSIISNCKQSSSEIRVVDVQGLTQRTQAQRCCPGATASRPDNELACAQILIVANCLSLTSTLTFLHILGAKIWEHYGMRWVPDLG